MSEVFTKLLSSTEELPRFYQRLHLDSVYLMKTFNYGMTSELFAHGVHKTNSTMYEGVGPIPFEPRHFPLRRAPTSWPKGARILARPRDLLLMPPILIQFPQRQHTKRLPMPDKTTEIEETSSVELGYLDSAL